MIGSDGIRTEALVFCFDAFSSREPESTSLENALAVKLQPVDDLVDHLALGAHRKTNQIKLGADHGPHRFAVGRIMRGLEHVLGIEGGVYFFRQRPPAPPGSRR